MTGALIRWRLRSLSVAGDDMLQNRPLKRPQCQACPSLAPHTDLWKASVVATFSMWVVRDGSAVFLTSFSHQLRNSKESLISATWVLSAEMTSISCSTRSRWSAMGWISCQVVMVMVFLQCQTAGPHRPERCRWQLCMKLCWWVCAHWWSQAERWVEHYGYSMLSLSGQAMISLRSLQLPGPPLSVSMTMIFKALGKIKCSSSFIIA